MREHFPHMSTATVIIAIVILLGALVSYAFAQQTVRNKREQKMRLLNSLKARARNYRYLLTGTPDGFLPKELTILVQRQMIDVCEQLSQLEPENPSHLEDFQLFGAQMSETQKRPANLAPPSLDNPHQIKEAKACLDELYKFVVRQGERQVIQKTQVQSYGTQIKSLVLKVTVDSYVLNGAQAKQGGKTKLSIHYYELAHNLILREGKSRTFHETVEKIKANLEALREEADTQEQPGVAPGSTDPEAENMQDEWEELSEAKNSWKKKNVYD